MRIHLEGMGIQGCLTAHFLDMVGIPFTWHDIDFPQTAWKASTGAIYPSNSMKFGDDMACHAIWERWCRDDFISDEHLEEAAWWFNHKSAPPHGGRYTCTKPTEHGLRAADDLWSYHFNAQTFVTEARERFAAQRGDRPAHDADAYVVTHGWSLRQSHVYWGWTRLVTLGYDDSIYSLDSGVRPSFYFREGRFIMAYAYPVAGTPYWYAGSHIIKQPTARARSLEMEPKYERWKANFERLGNGAVRVTGEGAFIEGWRPAARDNAWEQVERQGNRLLITYRPLWNNGIRHFPEQLRGLARALTEPKLHALLEPLS